MFLIGAIGDCSVFLALLRALQLHPRNVVGLSVKEACEICVLIKFHWLGRQASLHAVKTVYNL